MVKAPTEWLEISHSSRGTLAGCARKFELYKFYPRNRGREDGFAADVGTALHHAYQDYLIHEDEDRAQWILMTKYPYMLELSQKVHGPENDRSLEACLATLDEMIASPRMTEYELATVRRPDGIEVPAIEVPFAIRFTDLILPDGRGLAYTGFMDAIMRHKFTGQYRTMDIKTSRDRLKDKTPKYVFNSQQNPYGMVVEHLAGQAIESFEVLFFDCFVDLVDPNVVMWPFTRTREDMQEWLLDVVLDFQNIQRFMELNHFPRTSHGCLSFNRPCPYLDICPSRDRDYVMEWFLMGKEPVSNPREEPWIVFELEAFA